MEMAVYLELDHRDNSFGSWHAYFIPTRHFKRTRYRLFDGDFSFHPGICKNNFWQEKSFGESYGLKELLWKQHYKLCLHRLLPV